jgi:hypothetical protein
VLLQLAGDRGHGIDHVGHVRLVFRRCHGTACLLSTACSRPLDPPGKPVLNMPIPHTTGWQETPV